MIILDGAYGTNIQKGLTVGQLQESYYEAGADMVAIDCFDINIESYKLPELNNPNKPCYVSIGPSNVNLSLDFRHTEKLTEIYQLIARKTRKYTNTFLLETFSDLRNLKCAIRAIVSQVKDAKILVSISPLETGHILSGQTIKTVHNAIFPFANVIAFGFNCIRPETGLKFIEELSTYSCLPILFKPNMGLRRAFTYEFYKILINKLLDGKVNYLGACCGSVAEDINFIRTHSNLKPFEPHKFQLSGRISEKLNVNGSKVFKEACKFKDFFQIYKLFDVEAEAIDVNLDSLNFYDRVAIYKYIVNTPALKDKWICIDSTDKEFIEWAILNTDQPTIVNSIAEEKNESLISQIEECQTNGTIPIVRAFLPKYGYGTPKELTIIFNKIYRKIKSKLDKPILYDICIRALGMQEDHKSLINAYIKVVNLVKTKENLIPMCGISNASFLFRSNKNFRIAFNETVRRTLGIELTISNNLIPTEEQVILIKDNLFKLKKLLKLSTDKFDCEHVEYKSDIVQLLINQQTEALRDKTLPELLTGLDEICSLYDQMKMSLIQIVYASETINSLYPPQSNLKDTIAIGTVTGDIHSIGKNINISVLRAMGIGMYDLGVDLPFNSLKEALIKYPIIGLSALINPSLKVMEEQLTKLDAEGFKNVILLGGAAVDEEFVANLKQKINNLELIYSKNPLHTYEIYDGLKSRLDI